MLRFIIQFLFLVTIFLNTGRAQEQNLISIGQYPRETIVTRANAMALLVNPEKYQGKKIMTDLYMSLGTGSFESLDLFYALKEDLVEHRFTNAFKMSVNKELSAVPDWGKRLNNKRVFIVGIFRMNTKDVMYFPYGGAITNIEFIREAK